MNNASFTLYAAFSFLFGTLIGSFLNVVICRVPRGESIVSPPSHCPKCGAAIRWYQNIPILSWLALRGKCANCKAPISPRYILVETLGGLLFLAAALHNNPFYPFFWTPTVFALLKAWIWIALMIVGSMIDFEHKLLPDFVTVGGMVVGLFFAALQSLYAHAALGVWTASIFMPLFRSLLGLLIGFGLLWLVRYLGSKAFKREAMGMGDVFLLGAVGALFGPLAVFVTLILSSLFGSVVGLSLIALSKTRFGRYMEIPYGPYICMGCLAWMFYGPQLILWYKHLVFA